MDSPSPLRRSSRTSSCNKENSPLNSPSKRNTSAQRTSPEHDTTPTRKRRRQSVKPQTDLASNTSANAKQPPLHTQPTSSEQEALDAKKERDARKKARRSLGRRVSFAATARVRLFNKDATPEISPEAARKSRYFALDDLQESSLGSKESPLGLSMFQIPDLSSVVTGGDNTFDLRLSLDGSDHTTNQESDEREIEESSEQDVAPTTTEASLLPVPSDNQESHLIHVPTALSKIIGAEDVIIRRSSLGSNEDHMQRSGGPQEDILQTEDFAVFMDPPSFDDAMDMTECLGGINTEPFENTENILPCQSTRLDISQHHMPNKVEDRTADRFEMSPISSRRISMASPSYRTDNMHFAESSTAMDLTRCLGGIIADEDDSQQDEEVHNSIHDAICELERETNDPTMDITRCIGGIREAKPADHRYLASLAVIEEERKNVTAPVPVPDDDDLYEDHVEYNIHLNDGYHQADSSASFVADDGDDMDLTRCVGAGYRQEDDRCPGASNVSHESLVEENAQHTNPLLPLEPAAVMMEATCSADSEIISSATPRRDCTQRNTPTLVLEPPPGDMRTESPVAQDKENVVLKEPVARDCGPRPSEEPVKEKVPHCSPRRPRGGYVSSPLRTVTTMLSPGKVVTNVALSRQAVIVNRRKSLSAAAADLSSRLVSSTSTRRSSFAGALGKPAFEVENSSNGGMVSVFGNADSVPSPTKSNVENSSNGGMVSVSGNADPVPSPTKSTKKKVKKADTSAPPPAARRLSFTPATTRDSEKFASATPQQSPKQEHRISVVSPPLSTTTVTSSPGAPDCKSADLKTYSEPDRAKSPPLNTKTVPSSIGVPDYESTDLKAYSEPIRAKQPVESITSSPVSVQKRNSENDDAKNHLGELDEPCIFGEHLDIVDDSFIAEIPEPDPITLSTFFEMTGIHFMDELSSTKRRETLSEKENDGLPSFADCVKATAILCPELERNEFCCNELEKYITEGKRSVSKMEEAVNRDNPPVFADLIRTQPDSDDRNRMLANFRIMKSRARLEARSSWYRWREQLLNSAKCGLKTVSDQLKRDYKYVTRFAEQVDALLPELKQHRAILAARCEEARSRQEAISTCDRKQMQSLNEAIREQSTQVDFFRQQLVQAELEGTELNERATALEAEKSSLLGSISSARSSLDECAGFDAADLFRLRGEFDRLKRYHLWTPAAASRNALELVYDGGVRARIDVSGRSEKERVLESLNLVELEKDRTEKESRVTTATFLPGILHLSNPESSNTSRPISWTLRNVSAHCHRLGIIEQEISLLRLRRPVSVSHDASALRVRVTFVGLQRLVKFRVEFEIGFEGAENGGRGFRYPFGELKWTVEKAYGVVDEDTVSDVMSAHEQDGYHRLLGICRDLDVLTQ